MNLRLVFISIFLFGIYSRFHLNAGSLYVPYIFSLLSGTAIFVLNKGRLNARSFYFIISISIISVLVTVITILTQNIVAKDVIESLVLFIYSIALSVIFFEELLKFSSERLAEYFYKIIVTILVLCILDIFTPFHELNIFVVDLFGGSNQGDFTAERESAYFFGIRRPYPFTLEPSHVSKFLLIVISGWLVLSKKKNYKLFFLIVFLSIVIIRSPILLGSIIVILYYQMSENAAKKDIRMFSSRLIVVALLIVATSFFGFIILEARIKSVISGGDPSTYIRLFRPYLILYESLMYSPWIGVGIANNVKLAEIYALNNKLWLFNDLGSGYTVNALVSPLTYWGIAGTVLHLWVFISYVFKRVILDNLLAMLLLTLMISISMGGINTVNFVAYIMIIIRIFTNQKRHIQT